MALDQAPTAYTSPRWPGRPPSDPPKWVVCGRRRCAARTHTPSELTGFAHGANLESDAQNGLLGVNLLAAAAEGPEYASHATTRLSQITQDALFLQHIQAALLEHFTAPADA